MYLGSVRSPTQCTPLCLAALIMYLGHGSVMMAETFQHCTMEAIVDRGQRPNMSLVLGVVR